MPLFKHKLSRPWEHTAPGEIGPSQRMALFVLQQEGPMAMTALAKQLHIFKQQLTAIVDKLEKEGLISRMPDKHDRRIINVSISSKGEALLKLQFEQMKEAVKAKLSALPEKELEKLDKALGDIAEVLKLLP